MQKSNSADAQIFDSTTHWQRQRELFETLLAADAPEQAELLTRTHSENPELCASVLALLQAHLRYAGNTDAQLQSNLDAVAERLHAHAIDNALDIEHADANLGIGFEIANFRLVEEIGRGGMGVVWKGVRRDGEVEQIVAIKVLPPHRWDSVSRERFQQERNIAASLDHPGIARLIDAGTLALAGGQSQPYYAMELVSGRNIVEYAEERQLNIRARLQLFQDVLAAVDYSHRNLVIHRDLKPSNILVTNIGQIKLIDFGIAKSLNDVNETGAAQRFFSPAHAAPEQILGKNSGVSVDIYQLGTVLYQLLCDKPIFDFNASRAREIEESILHRIPKAPSQQKIEYSNSLKGDLDAITLKALRKSASERYQTVAQFAEDIQRHLQNRPILARTGQRWYQMSKFFRRNWLMLTVGLGISCIIVSLIISTYLQYQLSEQQRLKAIEARQHSDNIAAFLTNAIARESGGNDTSSTSLEDFLRNCFTSLDQQREQGMPYGVWTKLSSVLIRASFGKLPNADIESRISDFRSAISANDQNSLAEADLLYVLSTNDKYEGLRRAEKVADGFSGNVVQRLELDLEILRNRGLQNSSQLAEATAALKLKHAALLESDESQKIEFYQAILASHKFVREADPKFIKTIADECCLTQSQPSVLLRARAKIAYADALRRADKPLEAIPLAIEASTSLKAILGESSDETLQAINTLALTYKDAEKLVEAKQAFEVALAAATKFGEQRAGAIAAISYNIGEMCAWKLKDNECAELYLRNAVKYGEIAWGSQSTVHYFRLVLGTWLYHQKQFSAAFEIIEKAAPNIRLKPDRTVAESLLEMISRGSLSKKQCEQIHSLPSDERDFVFERLALVGVNQPCKA